MLWAPGNLWYILYAASYVASVKISERQILLCHQDRMNKILGELKDIWRLVRRKMSEA